MVIHLATFLCILGIWGLFLLERDRKTRTSRALWLPTIWISLAASRMVSQWLSTAPQPATGQQYIEGNPIDRAVLTGLLVVAIFVLVGRSRRVIKILRMNWPIILFFSYCAVSILWSDYPDVATKRWFKSLGDLVMVLVVLSERDRLAAIKRLLARIAFVLMPLSILFIEFYPRIGQSFSLEDGVMANTGVTMNKNELGSICMIIGIAAVWRLAIAFWDNSCRTRTFIVHGTILAMVLWLLYTAHSATSVACFLLGSAIVVVLTLPGRKRPARVHLIAGAAVTLTAVMILLPDAYAYFVQTLGRNTTLTGRVRLWNLLLSMNNHPWFGTGFQSFWLGTRLDTVWSLYGEVNEAHNGFLGVLLELGWVGVSLLALLLATGYRNVVASFRRDPREGSLKLGLFVIAVAYNFTEAAFRMMAPVWIFLLLAILAVPAAPRPENVENNEFLDFELVQDDLPIEVTNIHAGTS
jgi:exopolysaccharide production protein ExoQ